MDLPLISLVRSPSFLLVVYLRVSLHAGKGLANPTALLLSSLMMLRYAY